MSDPKPTIYLTNWSSRALFGPGRRLTIMTHPRSWEHGEGYVRLLRPNETDLDAARSGSITAEQYRDRYLSMLRLYAADLKPGRLDWLATRLHRTVTLQAVADGDTLCCACSRDAALRGECHRVWAGYALRRSGWDVVLDGFALTSDPEWARPRYATAREAFGVGR